MKADGKYLSSIWLDEKNNKQVNIIDQRLLPFELKVTGLQDPEEAITAISDMLVRGAPLIGVTAAYGIYLAALKYNNTDNTLNRVMEYTARLRESRPTAVNLAMAVDMMTEKLSSITSAKELIQTSLEMANGFRKSEIEACKMIGEHGVKIIEELYAANPGRPVQLMTHCNAGWLATVDHGTATAPIYLAHDRGIPVHVWVDETRPRNQGSRLTAWELGQHGVPHTVVADNAGGHLMQRGDVDLLITGSDRTALNGDTANKIGTYLKALAARDNNIPFYVALPVSSIDPQLKEGVNSIPVEIRSEDELRYIEGVDNEGKVRSVDTLPKGSNALNYGFDITPSGLIKGLITERGICKANREEISKLLDNE